jgi:hypothetical protein
MQHVCQLGHRPPEYGLCAASETHMSETGKVKGPASYFPSIEKKYGFPVSHWLALL